MFKFLLLVLLLLPSVSASARPRHRRPHARASLLLIARPAPSSSNLGAKFDPTTVARLSPRPLVRASKTFIDFHSARVQNDLMLFQPTLVGVAPAGRQRDAEAFRATGKRKWLPTAARAADELELRREQDRLLLFREPQSRAGAIGIGLAMFGVTTVLAAHLPRPFRVLFDRPVHLGPAIFAGGGMGAGIAGRGF